MLRSRRYHTAVSAMSAVVVGSMMLACSDTVGPDSALRAPDRTSQRVVVSDPSVGLVAAYGFEETSGSTAADASPNGNAGTFGSGVTHTTSGRFGNALSFSNGMVSIPDAASLHLTSAMTLEAWVNPTTVTSAWRSIVYKGDDNYYLMGTSSNGGRPAGGASFGSASTTEAYGSASLAANTWTHLAATYDGSMLRLYVNGTQVGTQAKSGAYTTSGNPLQIGGNNFYSQYFRGKIDEVRVYNRPLSASEIQTDMNTAVGSSTQQQSSDATRPTVAITSPTTTGADTTTASAIAVSGTASDNTGVTSVTWTNDRGGSGTASGTTNWSITSIPLQSGANVITVTAKDAANNSATSTITVNYSTSGTTPSSLSIVTQPSATTASGAAFPQQPAVQLRDANGVVVARSGVSVNASIVGGAGTLSGTMTTTTDANGVARFSNLTITGPSGARYLGFRSGSLGGVASNAVSVAPTSKAAKLVVSNIASQTANTPFSVTVTLTDANNTPVNNTGSNGTVTLSRQSGTGAIGGTTTGTIPVGSSAVTISGVTYSKAESGVALLATGGGANSDVNGKTGSSGSFTVVASGGGGTGSNSYATDFTQTESVLSEGGRWLNGGADGIDWTNFSTTPGRAIGHESGPTYTDATAVLKGTWGANQSVSANVFTSGAVSDGCYSEVELRLRSSIAAHDIHGYEISYKISSTSQAYLIIVRWNGKVGDFTYLLESYGAQYGVKNGDVVSAKIVGNTIYAYKNGTLMGQATDGTYANGNPGMGMNLENAPSGCSGTNSRYGYSHFSATDAVSP